VTSGERPLVSILTPSLNQARWLWDALASVSVQTYANIEHVVTDGGSSDGTVDLLTAANPRVIWRSEPDGGQSAALNAAFALSHGSIIGWLNADDAYFHAGVVDHVVRTFEAHPAVDVVYGHAALVNSSGLILHYLWAPAFSTRLLRRYNMISQPTAFVRRSAIGEALVDEDFGYAMDRELWLRLSRRGRFLRIDDVLAVDRHHPARKAYMRWDLHREDQRRLTERYAVPRNRRARLVTRGTKIWHRLRGLSLVVRPLPSLAFEARSDGRLRTAVRQIASRRAWMSVD
jgi:glycosyltransferase involved in cell wall biosynthesis